MKKNEIIELNGEEYTLELNRDSYVQIDKLCNIAKSMEIINRDFYKYLDEEEITDDFDPTKMVDITDESIQKEVEIKEKTLFRLIERSLYLWLYPKYGFTITKIREMIKPYLEDENKANELGEKVGRLLNECLAVREQYVEEQKNLKALANNKKN